MNGNKKIAKNTLIIYIRMIICMFVGVLSSRFALQTLGVSDYGLYNVVGGIIVMLNIISTALHTTTRRFINFEMGKQCCNLNKVFNICLNIHILMAVIIFILSETVGIWYVTRILNCAQGKEADAMFIFQISVVASMLGIINIPYQAVLESFEKFNQVAFVDILTSLFKLIAIYGLLFYSGNKVRCYALIIASISVISFIMYHLYCHIQWKNIIKIKKYKDKKLYKEILSFNNYIALGAATYLCRSQGSNLLVNFFFNTAINGSLAIAYTVENYILMFINNLNAASAPQVTQNYSAKNYERAMSITSTVTRCTILLMIIIVIPIYNILDDLLKLWLGNVPEYTLVFCQWTLISVIIRSLTNCIPPLIQATGKIRIFQVVGSLLELSSLPISYFLFKINYPPYTIIIIFTISTFINQFCTFYLMKRQLKINIFGFFKNSYLQVVEVLVGYFIMIIISNSIFKLNNIFEFFVSIIILFILCWYLGLKIDEREKVISRLKKKLW